MLSSLPNIHFSQVCGQLFTHTCYHTLVLIRRDKISYIKPGKLNLITLAHQTTIFDRSRSSVSVMFSKLKLNNLILMLSNWSFSVCVFLTCTNRNCSVGATFTPAFAILKLSVFFFSRCSDKFHQSCFFTVHNLWHWKLEQGPATAGVGHLAFYALQGHEDKIQVLFNKNFPICTILKHPPIVTHR